MVVAQTVGEEVEVLYLLEEVEEHQLEEVVVAPVATEVASYVDFGDEALVEEEVAYLEEVEDAMAY